MAELPTKSTITSTSTTPTANTEPTINAAEFIGDTIVAGGPTLCNYSRALISNTANQFAALSRDHACGIKAKVKGKQAVKTGLIAEMITTAREAIEALLKGESMSTLVSWAACQMRWLVKRLQELKRFIDKIQKMVDAVSYYVVFAAQMAEWILSLPAQLLTLMRDCLTDFLKGMGALLEDTFAGNSSTASFAEFDAAYKSLKTSYQAVSTTASSALSSATGVLNTASYNSLNISAPSVKQLTTYKSPI